MDRQLVIIDCIRRVERACGLQQKDEGTLDAMSHEWLQNKTLRAVPTDRFMDCCEWALENRSNQATPLTLQNMTHAARVLLQSGRIRSLVSKDPDPHCSHCKGHGAIVGLNPSDKAEIADDVRPYKLWEDLTSGELLSEGYTAAVICDCLGKKTDIRGKHPFGVASLMEKLRRLLGAAIPEPNREANAAAKLIEFGWSEEEILDCWQWLTDKLDRNALWSEVLPVIGRRYFSTLVKGDLTGTAAIAVDVVMNPIVTDEVNRQINKEEETNYE